MNRIFLQISIVSVMLTVCASSNLAQQTPQNVSEYWKNIGTPANSETNAVKMEYVRSLMQKDPHPDGVIILIARLGQGETKRELNRRRLFNVRERYIKTLLISPEKIVAAEGERVDGFGRVEIYWRGELAEVLAAFKNKDLHVYCCGPNDMYYPDKDALERRKKRQRMRQRRV